MKTIKTFKKIVFMVLATNIVLFSCTNSEKKVDEESVVKPIEKVQLSESVLQMQLDSLETNMKVQWDTLMYFDDLKMKYLLRLLDEITYIPGSNEVKIDSLKAFHKEVKELEMNRFELESAKIDLYDEQQTKLIKAVFAFTKNTANIEKYPLVPELMQDISTLDDQIISDRNIYDAYSIPYNRLLLYQKEGFKTLPKAYQNLKMATVFMLKPNYEEAEIVQ